MPRLLDLFHTYLREMRPEGAARLRRHLSPAGRTDRSRQYRRRPGAVTDVLFTEMLIQ